MSLPIRRRRPAPWRRLAPLAVIVLAAHLVLLRAVPDALVQPGQSEVRSFSTRTIVPAAPPPAVAAAGPRPPTARPAAR
ncbi:MAG TPA: hypothetical protein VLK85_24690, partial [Ramlibacter sp.]|nr:hypothetical protein [Ramlibacter sp.]